MLWCYANGQLNNTRGNLLGRCIILRRWRRKPIAISGLGPSAANCCTTPTDNLKVFICPPKFQGAFLGNAHETQRARCGLELQPKGWCVSKTAFSITCRPATVCRRAEFLKFSMTVRADFGWARAPVFRGFPRPRSKAAWRPAVRYFLPHVWSQRWFANGRMRGGISAALFSGARWTAMVRNGQWRREYRTSGLLAQPAGTANLH